MKARKIDLETYEWYDEEDPKVGGKIRPATQIRRILTAPVRNLNGDGLLKADDVAAQIDPRLPFALLSEEDWKECCKAINDVTGLGGPLARMVRNILHAPQIEVKEGGNEPDPSTAAGD